MIIIFQAARHGNLKNEHIIGINHCMEGRIEWGKRRAYFYLASGDIMLDSSVTENKECSFPLSHYHGIIITISVPEATDSMSDLLDLFSIDLSENRKSVPVGNAAIYYAWRYISRPYF